MDYTRDRKCDVCGVGFTNKSWEDRHDFHDLDCPNFEDFSKLDNEPIDIPWVHCNCDLIAHDKCCPQCHPKTAQRIRENQVLRKYKEEQEKHA
jgi:hypothetical protein